MQKKVQKCEHYIYVEDLYYIRTTIMIGQNDLSFLNYIVNKSFSTNECENAMTIVTKCMKEKPKLICCLKLSGL